MLKMVKRFYVIGLVLMVVSSFVYCDEEDPIELNQVFTLDYQQTKSNDTEGISIRFDDVIGDSRCPVDVVCVWEGDAEIQLTFSKGGDSETFTLHTALEPGEIAVLGYVIKLVGLMPAAIISTDPPSPENYSASLIISKLKPGTCTDNSQCVSGTYCAKETGDCAGIGTCTMFPDACPAVIDPVCGCDGNTYSDSCSAAVNGVNVAKKGECGDTSCDDGTDLLCMTFAPPQCRDYEILAIQNSCYACVNPQTCLPWGEPECREDKDCDSGICDLCGSSSCPDCDDCVPACVPW